MITQQFGPYKVELTNLDKILFPQSNITKRDLINYYIMIAEHMLYFIKDHPVTMYRFPEGIAHEGFYQKDISSYFPDWIQRAAFKTQKDTITKYLLCNNKATLAYIANQGCITPHIWLSKYREPYYPDRMIFDLDPSTDDFDLVRFAALKLKEILESKSLKPFAMTTGSRGIHVTIPLSQKQDFKIVKAFAQQCAQELIQEYPDKFTLEIKKDKRKNKLFIDTLRNNYSATAVAPYAIRPKEQAPVATPLFWEEVHNKKLTSRYYTIKTIFDKLKKDGDPWKDFYKYSTLLSLL